MMRCPRCSCELTRDFYDNIVSFRCPVCGGRAVTMSGLRTLGVDRENIASLWGSAVRGKAKCEICCPECGDPMQVLKVDTGDAVFDIDLCVKCHTLWFDLGELEKIPYSRCRDEAIRNEPAASALTMSAARRVRRRYREDGDRPPTVLEKLGLNEESCAIALRLLIRLILKI